MPARLRLRLPDASVIEVGPEAVLGRSAAATVRIADPRVSTVHAEISWREAGPMLLARGGRLLLDGQAVPEVVLEAGTRVELAPGVPLVVVEVMGEAPPIPATAGRESLRWEVRAAEVRVVRAQDGVQLARLTGVSARMARSLLEAGALEWDVAAAQLWPEDGALRARGRTGAADDWTSVDEQRLRNRWDQALHVLRRQLATVRGGACVETGGGTVALRLGPRDEVIASSEPPESP